MKKIYKILIAFCILTSIFITNGIYAFEYDKYKGTYYWKASDSNVDIANRIKAKDTYKIFTGKGNVNINNIKILESALKDSNPGSEGELAFISYNQSDLTAYLEAGEALLKASANDLIDKYNYKSGTPIYVLTDDYLINIKDESGKTTVSFPTYKVATISIEGGNKKVSYDLPISTNLESLIARLDTGKSTAEKVDFWGDASTWFGQAQSSGYQPPEQVDYIITTFEDMINVVGTTVIVIATIVLGIRYVIGSVENQTAAKEGLITLFIACIFFFGWSAISDLLYGGDKFDFIFTDSGDTTYEHMVGRIFSTFTYIAQFIVVAAIIYVGIKYIFAGATGRAELKGKSVYFIIGIILVFATSNVLSFISDIITDAL